MKKNIFTKLLMLVVLSGFLMAGECDSKPVKPNADKIQQAQTEQSLSEAQRQLGAPAILNFQELKLFKAILEARDQENLITHTYFFSELKGTIGQYLGKSIGYGIPASTQYTNPEKVVHKSTYQGGSFGTLPQADPNGLFMPTSTSATWVFLLDDKGVPRPVFVEPLIIVSPIKLH